jgi:hypothetical protein
MIATLLALVACVPPLSPKPVDTAPEATETGDTESEPCTTPYYRDADGDTFGDPFDATTACEAPPGYVPDHDDCDDDEPLVHPGAAEGCDHLDNDCDLLVDDDDPDIQGQQVWYQDEDQDGYGLDLSVTACEAPEPVWEWSLVSGDCDDTESTVSPGSPEQCGNLRDDDCSGDATGCPYEREGDTSAAALVIVGVADGEKFGHALASGDLDGDGAVDVVVGAFGHTYVAEGDGGVYVIPGGTLAAASGGVSIDELPGVALWTDALEAGQAGREVDVAKDLDDDGLPDVVVGARAARAGDGEVYVLLGGRITSGLLRAAPGVLTGASGDFAGATLFGRGDLDGDGVNDLYVGASNNDRAYLISGDAFPVQAPAAEVATWTLQASDSLAGDADVLDYDFDGEPDVALLGAEQGGGGAGAIYAVDLPITGDLDPAVDARGTVAGAADADRFGWTLAIVPDLTGDGVPDVTVGASGADTVDDGGGIVYVLDGTGPWVTAGGAWTIADAAWASVAASAGGAGVGFSAASAEDFTGDGAADLTVGAYGFPVSFTGRVFVQPGPLAPRAAPYLLEDEAYLSFVGLEEQQRLGSAVLGYRDIDRDGDDEVLVGSSHDEPGETGPGAVYLFSGGTSL